MKRPIENQNIDVKIMRKILGNQMPTCVHSHTYI
jgi:hypothetical protein